MEVWLSDKKESWEITHSRKELPGKVYNHQGLQSKTTISMVGKWAMPPARHLSYVAYFYSSGEWEQLFLIECPEIVSLVFHVYSHHILSDILLPHRITENR